MNLDLIHQVPGTMGTRNRRGTWFANFQNPGTKGVYLCGTMILERGTCSMLVGNDIPGRYGWNEDSVPRTMLNL